MTAAITFELQWFYESFAEGKRPKLAIEMPPQHGKSLAVEDSSPGSPARGPTGKRSSPATAMSLSLSAIAISIVCFRPSAIKQSFQIFLSVLRGARPTTDLIEYVNEPGSFRNTTISQFPDE